MHSNSKLALLAILLAAAVGSTASAQFGSPYPPPGRPTGPAYDPFGHTPYPANVPGLPPQVQRLLEPAGPGVDPFAPGWPQDGIGGYGGGRRAGYPTAGGFAPSSPFRRDVLGPNRPLVGGATAPRVAPAAPTREDNERRPSVVAPVVTPVAVDLPRLHHEVTTPTHLGTSRASGGRTGGWLLGGLGAVAAAVWGFLKWVCGVRERPSPSPASPARPDVPSAHPIGLGVDGRGGVLLRPGPPPRP